MADKKMTKIMGIVNVTPDSFYAKSRNASIDLAIEHAFKLAKEGADILDIGGESTRPSATSVSVDEELQRVIPVFKALHKHTKAQLSIDTMKPEVAEACLQYGATFINDVTGFTDPKMRKIAASSKTDICVMHMQGTPTTMQIQPFYEKGVVKEVVEWLNMQAKLLIGEGVEPEHIILDPGIGFGKTVDDNFALLKHIAALKHLGFRLLYGVSRKSFLKNFLNITTEELLPATVAVNSLLIRSSVDIIRVHDVKEHKEALELLQKIDS
jgi:dihydropteroate synthase